MGNFKAFGRSYSSIGESDSDFLIKTKGQVKIQWGNKFIDLIKNGKINVETSFIFKEDSVGEKDGIYVIEDDQSVWLVVNGEQINLKGETGNTYVSFLAPQEVTLEQKYQALQNIGFIYPTISDANSYNIQNGIIYIEETQKLYIIINGSLTEYTAKLPNPVTEQFVIAKNDSKQGAILIKGEGIENSLAFNSFYLYSEFGISYIQSDDPLFIKFGDFRAIQIDNKKSIFNNSIVCDEIRSKVSDNSKGFHIYYINGESFLEVDNLIVRNSQENYSLIYPEFILGEINVIKSVKFVNSKELEINLQYINNFEINDILTTINTINVTKYNYDYLNTLTTYNELEPILIELELLVSGNTYYTTDIDQIKLDIIEAQSVYTTISNFELTVTNVKEQIISITSNIELEESISNILINQLIFKKTSFDGTLPIRIKDSNIDIIEYEQTISDPDKGRQATVKSRFGNLSELNIKEINSGSDVNITGSGIYSDQGYFKKAGYVKDYVLDPSDDSSKFASTEWVNNAISVSVSSSKDIDLTFQQLKDPTDPDYTQSYLENEVRKWITKSGSVWDFNDIGKLISDFGDSSGSESESFLCQNGFITLTIYNDGRDYVEVSAIIKAYTNSFKWSYRALHFKFNDDDLVNKISEVHTFIIDDGKLNPGFYYSEKLNSSHYGPESPVYLGTIIPSGWEVDSTKKYLWYTTDGKNWILQSSYVEADSNYIYIISTSRSRYIDTKGNTIAFPSGFVTYCSNIDNTQTPPIITTSNPKFGFEGYINPITITDITDIDQNNKLTNNLNKLKELVGKNTSIIAKEGGVPKYSGFNYVWKIEKTQYDSLPQYLYNSWEQANSFQINKNLIKSVNNSDWGNSLDAPGWRTFKINNNNQIIADTYIDNLYSYGIGTSVNWNNRNWKIAFLRSILRYFLQENIHRYDNILGWNFDYDGVINCTGYQGSWSARIGGIESPTKDANQTDIDYYPTSTLANLSGNVTSPEGIVHFIFTNVKLGKLRNDLGIGLSNLSPGAIPQYVNCLYDVDFEECKYKFESF